MSASNNYSGARQYILRIHVLRSAKRALSLISPDTLHCLLYTHKQCNIQRAAFYWTLRAASRYIPLLQAEHILVHAHSTLVKQLVNFTYDNCAYILILRRLLKFSDSGNADARCGYPWLVLLNNNRPARLPQRSTACAPKGRGRPRETAGVQECAPERGSRE